MAMGEKVKPCISRASNVVNSELAGAVKAADVVKQSITDVLEFLREMNAACADLKAVAVNADKSRALSLHKTYTDSSNLAYDRLRDALLLIG